MQKQENKRKATEND